MNLTNRQNTSESLISSYIEFFGCDTNTTHLTDLKGVGYPSKVHPPTCTSYKGPPKTLFLSYICLCHYTTNSRRMGPNLGPPIHSTPPSFHHMGPLWSITQPAPSTCLQPAQILLSFTTVRHGGHMVASLACCKHTTSTTASKQRVGELKCDGHQ